jgi:hypothetical protein
VVVVVEVVSLFTSGGGAVVVVVVSVCFTCGYAGVVVVSVVLVVWACDAAVGSWEVVVVDCVVLWATTGRQRAITMSEPMTTASSFFDFIHCFLRLWSEVDVMVWLPLSVNLFTITLSERSHTLMS